MTKHFELDIKDASFSFRRKRESIKARPIHHRLADRVRAHIFLYTLAYYVEWHMREAWQELMFADEDQQAKRARDPVALAKRSVAAELKVLTHTLEDGSPAHSFSTLLAELRTIVRNTCHMPNDEQAPTFHVATIASSRARASPPTGKASTLVPITR